MTEQVDESTSMLEMLGITADDHIPDDEVVDDGQPDVYEIEQPTTVIAAPPSFSVMRQVLTSMVTQAMLVVKTTDFYPPLKNFVLDVSEDRLSITGSDSTSTVVSHTTAVRVERPGRVLIGAQKFFNVVKGAGGMDVTVSVEDQHMQITSGAASWGLRVATEQNNYPPLPDLGDLTWHTVDRKAFDRAIAGTRYAAGSDEVKDHFMQLDISGGTVVASDGVCYAQVLTDMPGDLSCSFPVGGVDLLSKMLERNEAPEFRVADTEYHLVAEVGPAEAPDRLIVAHSHNPFPAEAKSAILAPLAENRDVLTVDGEQLVEALRRAVPTSDDETLAVALRVGVPDASSVQVATKNRYGDLSLETVAGKFVRLGVDTVPPARTVVLNHDRLIKAIRAAQVASPGGEGSDGSTQVRLLLGENRSRSRPAFVLVANGAPEGEPGAGAVQAVLSQVRSEWLS